MKNNATEEFIRVLLENISNLILMPQFVSNKDYKTATQLFNAMNPIVFQRPTEKELQTYIKLVETLKPLSKDDKKAIQIAKEDLYYILKLKG